MGGRHYDWISVEEDMPLDDPENPRYSIPVKVKLIKEKSEQIVMAIYDNRSNRWFRADGMNAPIRAKVGFWTSDF